MAPPTHKRIVERESFETDLNPVGKAGMRMSLRGPLTIGPSQVSRRTQQTWAQQPGPPSLNSHLLLFTETVSYIRTMSVLKNQDACKAGNEVGLSVRLLLVDAWIWVRGTVDGQRGILKASQRYLCRIKFLFKAIERFVPHIPPRGRQ